MYVREDTFVFKHPEVAPSIVRDGKSTAELRKQNKLVFYRFRFSLTWGFVTVVKESSMFVCDVLWCVVRSFHIFQSIPQDEIVVDHIVHMGQGPLRRHLVWLARWSRYSGRFTDRASSGNLSVAASSMTLLSPGWLTHRQAHRDRCLPSSMLVTKYQRHDSYTAH